MILAVVFCVFALIGIIRLVVFAGFTAHEKNTSGAVMLYVFAFIILVCAVFAVIRL